MAEKDDEAKLASVKYYQLNDGNAHSFYDEWLFKTMAIIRKKGWGDVFDLDQDKAISSDDETLIKHNAECYDQILMGCSGIPLGLVRRAKGDAREAVSRLSEKYANQNESDLTTLLTEFTNCKLESTATDPDLWFLKLDGINEKLRNIKEDYAKRDYEVKAHILGNLPDGYSEVVTKLSGRESELTVASIEKEISSKWKRSFKNEAEELKSSNLAMSVDQSGGRGRQYKGGNNANKSGGSNKKFKGRCRKCGKQGHKKSDCKSDKNGVCFNCGEDGHFAKDCPKKSKDSSGSNGASGTGMFVGMVEHVCKAVTIKASNEEQTFLLDSGASTHVIGKGKAVDGLFDPSTSSQTVRVGNGAVLKATKQGNLFLRKKDNILKLAGVQYVPGFVKNIVSLGKLSSSGYNINFQGRLLTIEMPSSGKKIMVEKNEEGLYYLEAAVATRNEVHPVLIEGNKDGTPPKPKKSNEIDINNAHELYGHLNYASLHPLLISRGYVIYEGGRNKKTCEACAYAKAKAKGVSKTTSLKANEKGERLFMDISGPYKMSLKGSKYWLLIVDDKTRKAWSFFVKNKSDAKKVTASLLSMLKGASVVTKYLRCDNAGENVKGLKELCNEQGIKIELTPPNSPQFNGVVERKFVTLRDRAQAMMLGAHLNDEFQGRLWAEAVYTATRIHNAVPNQHGPAPDELWYGTKPVILDHLVQFGRIGFVTIREKQPKMKPKSVKMVFLGYAPDHAGGVYRMYNPETKRVVESRDVVWAEWHGNQSIPSSLKMFVSDVDPKDESNFGGWCWTMASPCF
jgi:hypothetical protein